MTVYVLFPVRSRGFAETNIILLTLAFRRYGDREQTQTRLFSLIRDIVLSIRAAEFMVAFERAIYVRETYYYFFFFLVTKLVKSRRPLCILIYKDRFVHGNKYGRNNSILHRRTYISFYYFANHFVSWSSIPPCAFVYRHFQRDLRRVLGGTVTRSDRRGERINQTIPPRCRLNTTE